MMRKLMMTLAAVASLAGGAAAVATPAEAKVHVFVGIGSPGYYPGYYGHPGFYEPDFYDPPYYYAYHRPHFIHPVKCRWVKVWHHHRWIKVRKCRRIWY